jgi:nucleoside-diphosphate-sugar epimerase
VILCAEPNKASFFRFYITRFCNNPHRTAMPRNTKGKILVIGALGQIGQDLISILYEHHGPQQVLAADVHDPKKTLDGPFYLLNVMDREKLFKLIREEQVEVMYNLAAILSAKGEKDPDLAWSLNMTGLLNGLEALRHTPLRQLFWPSSIAVFGPHSPRKDTPQYCTMDPNTVYGISKLAGERWCEYYAQRYGVDVRSLRYPGLISYKAEPGGGTTDYAVNIFHDALQKGHYTSFLDQGTYLPMMYMPDAIRATLELMEAPSEAIRNRSSYNLSGMSFAPEELVKAIQEHLPDFTCDFEPDFRQQIADSWPGSIDDSEARRDWGWKPTYDLSSMTAHMIKHLQPVKA